MQEDSRVAGNDQKEFRINGQKYTAEKRKAGITVTGEVCASKTQPRRTPKAGTLFGTIETTEKNACSFWWKDTGYGFPQGGGYVRVMKRRVWPAIVLLVAAIAAICLIYYLFTRQNAPKNAIDYIGDKTGIVNTNSEVKGEIAGYTSFESVQDQVWDSADETQPLLLKDLEGNPVDICPRVYLDLDKDGRFTDDECIWKLGNDGQGRIAPGHEVDTISPDRKLAKGSYDAQVVYLAYMQGTDTPANGMNFSFKVTVK